MALAEQFRLRQQKQIQKEDRRETTHFKLRVLDLIEIYIRRQSSNPLIIEVVMPLLNCMRISSTPADKPLFQRVVGLLKNKFAALREYPRENLDVERTHDILNKVLEAALFSGHLEVCCLAWLLVVL